MPRSSRDDHPISLLISHLPWWVSLVLALLSYLVLTFLPYVFSGDSPISKGFSTALPIIAPIVGIGFLAIAAMSALESWNRSKLLASQKSIDTIQSLHWSEFEKLVAEFYRRQGYFVTENRSQGPDGGVDIVIEKDRSQTLVQCKNWKSAKVGVKVLREMYGLVHDWKAQAAIIVTSGTFTQDARSFAAGKNIDLIDGAQLVELIRSVQANRAVRSDPPHCTQPLAPVADSHRPSGQEKACPRCGGKLIRRVAKKGRNTGRAFWGCSSFPRCRFTEAA